MEVKVESVKEVMEDSVRKALRTVETLEDMDEKSELFEDKAKTFQKRAVKIKEENRSKYRKVG